MNKFLNIPNLLTISRIILIPVIVFCFFLQTKLGNFIVLSIFVFCLLTDFLDGYLARIYKQTTKLGQILDPIADKTLICSTILLIIGFHKVSDLTMIPACIILCREVMTSEIRDIVNTNNKTFQTSVLAKWKTALQMISITVILTAQIVSENQTILTLGEILFWISSVIALCSVISYYIKYWDTIS